MLGIPFIDKYFDKVLKVQKVADSVDWLNYYLTSMILAFFAFMISAKQYFGSPIQCWVPNEFRGGWEKYTESYCFIANSYFVDSADELPPESERHDQLSYYRWVPVVLALQAILFYLPNWFWNMLHKQTAINPRSFLDEAMACKNLHGEERVKAIDDLSKSFMEGVSVFGSANPRLRTAARSGYNAMYLYLFTKCLYVLNIFLQMYLMNKFLGGVYFNWGYDVVSKILQGEEWAESEVFPRVILCDFKVRVLGQTHRHTVQCVIMMNMINEKLYLFLYFWFMFVGFLTFCNCCYYMFMMLIPSFRAKLILDHISKKNHHKRSDEARFVHECLHPDGVLLLKFIREHVGGRIANELTNKLLEQYAAENSSMSSIEKHHGGPPSPMGLPPKFFQHYGPPPSKQHFYPHLHPSSTPNKTIDSTAPPLEEYINQGTMKMSDKKQHHIEPPSLLSPDCPSRTSPTDV